MIDQMLSFVPPWLIILLVVFGVVNGTVAYLILLERKVASWVQDRIGPNRVGPMGFLQPIADGLKMFLKEDYRPAGTDKILFTLAPCLMMIVIVASMAILPWGGIMQGTKTVDLASQTAQASIAHAMPIGASLVGNPNISDTTATFTYRYSFQIADVNIGVLFLVAMLSLAIYGVVLGGWSSNSKYSFLGGMRAAAQMVSYEAPLGLALLCVVLMFGTLNLGDIIAGQAHSWHGIPAWNVFAQPLPFLMFLICMHAEANRAPFDFAECEQELVGGYHTEYSSMRFGLFFLGEYTGMFITSCVCVALFFGGWHLPGLEGHVDPTNPAVTDSLMLAIIRSIVFFSKSLVIIFVFMWVRWSLPRFRFDQLMSLAWRALIPIALILLLGTAGVVYYFPKSDAGIIQIGGREAFGLLTMNAAMLVVFLAGSRLLPSNGPLNSKVAIASSRFSTEPVAIPAK